MRVVIIKGKGQFWGEFGASHSMGPLLCSCAEVHEPIELLFDMVSGVGPGIDVQNEGPQSSCMKGKGRFLGLFASLVHWFQWHIFKGNVFDSCVKS